MSKRHLLDFKTSKVLMEPGAYLHQAQLTPSQVYISRGIAGILTRTILSPLDVLQTINQLFLGWTKESSKERHLGRSQ